MYNGLDIDQFDQLIKLSCRTYITKILKTHGWLSDAHEPVRTPMYADAAHIKSINETIGPTNDNERYNLQQSMGFSYRQAIGELLFAAVTCRPDILYAVIRLSNFSTHPAEIHYTAVKRVFRYLRSTINEGLHYWRIHSRDDLPTAPVPAIPPDNHEVNLPGSNDANLHGYVDADWASDTRTRRSMTGIGMYLAGAPVAYRARLQPTVAMSTTESEFVAASDAGKMALYLRSVLSELGLNTDAATPLYEDNAAAIKMANAQRPTRRTRHLDIRHFALLDWVERDQVILAHISTHDNPADGLTKSLQPVLFGRHCASLLGKRKPSYCTF